MKKYFITLVVLMTSFGFISASDADKLISNFSKEKNANIVTISETMSKFAQAFSDELKGFESAKILKLEDCSSKTKEKFAKEVNKLKNEGYETLMRSNKEGREVRIMLKSDGETIKELLIITTGENPSVVTIKGKFSKSDLAALTGN